MKNIIFHITFDPWRPQMLGHTTSFKKGMVIKMKNGVIPYSMWVLFAPTFRKHLPILGITEGKSVMKRAKAKYRSIIKDIPSFGKNDILLVNLLSAAQIAAVYLSLDEKPPLEQMTEYYNLSMDDSRIMRIFLKSTDYYSVGYQKKLARQAEQSQLSDNPYSSLQASLLMPLTQSLTGVESAVCSAILEFRRLRRQCADMITVWQNGRKPFSQGNKPSHQAVEFVTVIISGKTNNED